MEIITPKKVIIINNMTKQVINKTQVIWRERERERESSIYAITLGKHQ
jgi:hypothetical protein